MAKERADRKDFFKFSYPENMVLITSMGKQKKTNVTPIAWHTPVSFKPPIYLIAMKPSNYSHMLIKQQKEFVINFLEKDFAQKALQTGEVSGQKKDKFREFGLAKEPSEMIDVPRIKQAYAALECNLISTIKSGDHDLFLGEVVHVKIKPDIMKGGILDLSKIQPLLYLGNNVFCTTSDYIMKPKT